VVVDTWPYRRIRHPGYLGSLLNWLGFGVTTGSAPAAAAVTGLMGFAYRRRIDAEERMLRARLGAAYERYPQRTWRLVPFIW
jgi:protein-S-isoprenylcysteine O-methyltransferase Ste14